MGFLTTVLIRNDGLEEILKNSGEFCEKLYELASVAKGGNIGVGGHANAAEVKESRHASNPIIYVQIGNTLIEMGPHSDETLRLMRSNPEFFKEAFDYLKQQTQGIEKNYSNYKASNKIGKEK